MPITYDLPPAVDETLYDYSAVFEGYPNVRLRVKKQHGLVDPDAKYCLDRGLAVLMDILNRRLPSMWYFARTAIFNPRDQMYVIKELHAVHPRSPVVPVGWVSVKRHSTRYELLSPSLAQSRRKGSSVTRVHAEEVASLVEQHFVPVDVTTYASEVAPMARAALHAFYIEEAKHLARNKQRLLAQIEAVLVRPDSPLFAALPPSTRQTWNEVQERRSELTEMEAVLEGNGTYRMFAEADGLFVEVTTEGTIIGKPVAATELPGEMVSRIMMLKMSAENVFVPGVGIRVQDTTTPLAYSATGRVKFPGTSYLITTSNVEAK